MLITWEKVLSIRNGWKILPVDMPRIYKHRRNKNYLLSQLLKSNKTKSFFPSREFKAKLLIISKRIKKIPLIKEAYLKQNNKYPSRLCNY